MRLLLMFVLVSSPLLRGEPVDPKDPKLFRQQEKVIEKPLNSIKTVPTKPAPGLYRSWINPVKKVSQPSDQSKNQRVVSPKVRNPALEQTFFKSKEWKPGRVVHLYEKSKDFDTFLNPLSLKDFNRFIYQRNPSSP